MAHIRIKDLRLRTYIGINADEVLNKQDVVINLALWYDASAALAHDRIEDAVNYRTIVKAVIRHVEERRFKLLERLAQDVLDLAMASPAVHAAEVEVDKPHALRFADSVSVTLCGAR